MDTAIPTITSDPTSTCVAVTAWHDPIVDEHGHDARSIYVEKFFLPVIGPTASFVLRRLADLLDSNPDGIEVDLADLAQQMGLSYRAGNNSPFAKALQRLVMFGLAHQTAHGLAVRCRIPSVPQRHLNRMPISLQTEHRNLLDTTVSLDDFSRAHTIALAMRSTGDTPARVERQLVAIGTPATVAEAVAANLADLDRS